MCTNKCNIDHTENKQFTLPNSEIKICINENEKKKKVKIFLIICV